MFLDIDELRSGGSRIAERCVTTVCDKAFVLFIVVLPSFVVCHFLLHFGTPRYVLAAGASHLRLPQGLHFRFVTEDRHNFGEPRIENTLSHQCKH